MLLTGFSVLSLAVLAVGGQSLGRVWSLKQEVDGLEREIATLRAETNRLMAVVDRLRTDPEYIEQVAREDLGLVKPGERILKLPPTPGSR
ncbi:MAG TPA: septum formation initiator family protein [Methylomirabilota bacterium]|nr:septum formation initiator family protein [Methylomirabilota bacterium]